MKIVIFLLFCAFSIWFTIFLFKIQLDSIALIFYMVLYLISIVTFFKFIFFSKAKNTKSDIDAQPTKLSSTEPVKHQEPQKKPQDETTPKTQTKLPVQQSDVVQEPLKESAKTTQTSTKRYNAETLKEYCENNKNMQEMRCVRPARDPNPGESEGIRIYIEPNATRGAELLLEKGEDLLFPVYKYFTYRKKDMVSYICDEQFKKIFRIGYEKDGGKFHDIINFGESTGYKAKYIEPAKAVNESNAKAPYEWHVEKKGVICLER
jgi:hypothetical protein